MQAQTRILQSFPPLVRVLTHLPEGPSDSCSQIPALPQSEMEIEVLWLTLKNTNLAMETYCENI